MIPPSIKIMIDEKTIRDAMRILRAVPGGVERVFQRSINRTVTSAATDLKRQVGKILPVPLGEIANGIKKKWATKSNWYGSIGAKYYRVPISKYKGTRSTRKGVTFRSSRTQARELIEHGFFATMKSGHRGVFTRARYTESKKGEKMQSGKEAIFQLVGPSIWQIITDQEGLLAETMVKAGTKLEKNIDHQVGYELQKWAKR